jgi:hypothetical protein
MSKEIRNCYKINNQCGYLNFHDDIKEIMDNYKIKSVIVLEKQVKALSIIKEKNIDILSLKATNSYDEYLKTPAPRNIVDEYGMYHKEQVLTQEEYDLLKEVLL